MLTPARLLTFLDREWSSIYRGPESWKLISVMPICASKFRWHEALWGGMAMMLPMRSKASQRGLVGGRPGGHAKGHSCPRARRRCRWQGLERPETAHSAPIGALECRDLARGQPCSFPRPLQGGQAVPFCSFPLPWQWGQVMAGRWVSFSALILGLVVRGFRKSEFQCRALEKPPGWSRGFAPLQEASRSWSLDFNQSWISLST